MGRRPGLGSHARLLRRSLQEDQGQREPEHAACVWRVGGSQHALRLEQGHVALRAPGFGLGRAAYSARFRAASAGAAGAARRERVGCAAGPARLRPTGSGPGSRLKRVGRAALRSTNSASASATAPAAAASLAHPRHGNKDGADTEDLRFRHLGPASESLYERWGECRAELPQQHECRAPWSPRRRPRLLPVVAGKMPLGSAPLGSAQSCWARSASARCARLCWPVRLRPQPGHLCIPPPAYCLQPTTCSLWLSGPLPPGLRRLYDLPFTYLYILTCIERYYSASPRRVAVLCCLLLLLCLGGCCALRECVALLWCGGAGAECRCGGEGVWCGNVRWVVGGDGVWDGACGDYRVCSILNLVNLVELSPVENRIESKIDKRGERKMK